ncbi:nose resistant to fluoxetine protein 6-like [Atheta coriaria]|uniref:nose resistant to fluoxetine protein 6-like n=1 Tax=Dalotia coriaria TaxID=877792 RepID=UPI0031F3DEAE
MALNFILKTLLVTVCVLGVSSEFSANDTKMISEIMNKLNDFPQTFLRGLKDLNASPDCIKAMKLYEGAVASGEEWAWKMLDAMSKLQSGILAGNMYNLGAYDECQSIRDVVIYAPNRDISVGESRMVINGKYCLGAGQLIPGISIGWAMCSPDACSADDLNILMASAELPIYFSEINCHDPSLDPEITGGDIAVIVCFGIILGLMVVSSIYDVYLRYFNKKTIHPILLAFSAVTNGEKLFATTEPGTITGQLECLSGIRSISMMWVLIGHVFNISTMVGVANTLNFGSFITDGWTMYIRGATVSVDSFFLMGGIVMIYVYLKSTKDKQTFNVFLYYLHRYLRLTPAMAAVLVVHITILKHFGSGPYWPMIGGAYEFCEKYWWSTLLYIQNYVNPEENCIGQSWYLQVDMQLFLLSPLILFPIKRWPRLTLAAIVVAALASISTGFAVAWVHKLTDINSINLENPNASLDYMKMYYTATYTRAAPWLIGIIVGYFIYKIKVVQKGEFKMSRLLNLCLWAGSLAVLATCVFVDKLQDEYDRLDMSSYIAFLRPAWSIALSWLIFACVNGYGGPINAFLSSRVFQVLARLTYSMYLIHFTVLMALVMSIKQPLLFSNAQIMYEFWSIFALVFAISVVWTLAFESPVIIIEKLIFGGGSSKKPVGDKATSKPIDVTENINSHIGSPSNLENRNVESGLHHRLGGTVNNPNGVVNAGYVEEKPKQSDMSIIFS